MMSTLAESSKFIYPAPSPLDAEFQFNRSPYSQPVVHSRGSTSRLVTPASASNTSLNKELPEPPAVLTPLRSSGVYQWANRPKDDVPPLPPFSFATMTRPPSEERQSPPPSRFTFNPRITHNDLDEFGAKRHVSWSLVYPALVVFLLAVALASLLLVYVLVLRSVKQGERVRLNQIYGVAFYVREGGTVGKMLGLLISAATTHIIVLTCPILVSVYAYCIAGLWLSAQASKKRTHRRGVSVPTPFQYGMLMTLMSAPSLKNLLRTARYLARGSKRPRAPNFLSIAFGGVASVVLNSLFICLADVWLHATASILYTEAPSESSPDIIVSSQITRYPLASLLTYTFLVYSYGLLALVIYLFALTSSSPTVHTNSRSVPTALELAHVQLSDPLSLVANLWPSPRGTFTSRRVQDLFPEDDTTLRLEVGLDQTSGHCPDFRVYRRIVPWKTDLTT